jgi:hypothetical protein
VLGIEVLDQDERGPWVRGQAGEELRERFETAR